MNPDMILSKFEVKFYEQLENYFSLHHFNLQLNQKQFRKVVPNGFQNIIFSVSETQKEFWIEVNFGVRNEFIEQIAQQFLNNALSYRPSANTLVISIGKFQDLKYYRFKITDEDDLNRILEEVKNFFEKKGFDFLDNNNSIKNIDDILNDSPTQPCRFVYNQIHRCFKGIIAAKLSDNQNFATITNIYRHFLLKNGTVDDLLNYERLMSFLYHYNAN